MRYFKANVEVRHAIRRCLYRLVNLSRCAAGYLRG